MHYIPLLLQLVLLMSGCSQSEALLSTTPEIPMVELTRLPAILDESSGLELTAADTFWSHNDHGGAAALYAFDQRGTLLKALMLANGDNEDWEDLAQDAAGNLYIGDFGNNDNDRQNLRIYKVKAADLNGTNIEISIEKIQFKFVDQTAFPPPETEHFFDVEAFFALEDQLFLFTRDRSKPFSGTTRLYQLPNTPGNHEATFIATFTTAPKKNAGQITAADISPDGSQVALLSNLKVWLFSDFSTENFFAGTVRELDLPVDRQLESIVFKDNCMLYLTNEKNKEEPAMLYELNICSP